MLGFLVGVSRQEGVSEVRWADSRHECIVHDITIRNGAFCNLLRRNLLVLLILLSGALSFGILTATVVSWNFFGLGNDLSVLYSVDRSLVLVVLNYAS